MIKEFSDTLIAHSHSAFLNQVASEFLPGRKAQVIMIIHCLDNALALLDAISRTYRVSRVIPIPYSAKRGVLDALSSKFRVTSMSLEELELGIVLKDIITECILSNDLPVVLFDMGGYFARVIGDILETHPGRLIGVIEETEAGHRRYLEASPLSCPIVSVARSSLKGAENRLVGKAIAFSAERILRECGLIPLGLRVGMIGYGNIGQPLSRALLARGMRVSVDDLSETRRCWAICDGYDAPGKQGILETSDVIIGVTGCQSIGGSEMSMLPFRVFLMSGSSKRVEFDTDWIMTNATHVQSLTRDVSVYTIVGGKKIALVCEGQPINFSDRAELGPVITLVHAEVIASAQFIIDMQSEPLLNNRSNSAPVLQIPAERQEKAARLWLSCFT
jgi:adenosylhomocysteinase